MVLKIFKRNLNSIAALSVVVCLIFIASCKKEQLPPPSYQESVYFYIPYDDVVGVGGKGDSALIQKAFSTNFSFFFLGDNSIMQDTFWLPTVRVMGNSNALDRDITLAADSSSNAVAGKHYQLFTNYKVAAGSLTAKIGLLLLRSPDLNDTSATLSLKIMPNASFPASVGNDTLTTDNNFFIGGTYRISITNKSVQPPFWNDVASLMGKWSKVKYQFIIDNTGKYLGLTPNNAAEQKNLVNYYFIIKTALKKYNDEHPGSPLTDENGNPVGLV